jgi:hypothetical protein
MNFVNEHNISASILSAFKIDINLQVKLICHICRRSPETCDFIGGETLCQLHATSPPVAQRQRSLIGQCVNRAGKQSTHISSACNRRSKSVAPAIARGRSVCVFDDLLVNCSLHAAHTKYWTSNGIKFLRPSPAAMVAPTGNDHNLSSTLVTRTRTQPPSAGLVIDNTRHT